jgi:hypothetical protein
MFTKKVTDDDNFMSLSSSAQALYLHLSMSADDDGFCNQVTIAMFKAHASVQDLQALLEKRYIYQFENGVIVIKHWRMANALRKDRYTPTAFQEELARLNIKENGSYTWLPDGCQAVANRLPDGCRVDAVCLPQDSIGKDSIVEDNNTLCDPPKKKTSTKELREEFEECWKLYPKKQGSKDKAFEAYKKARAEGTTKADVLIGINNFKAYVKFKGIEDQYIPYGQTFFCQKRWENDYGVKEHHEVNEHTKEKHNAFNDFEQHDYDWDQLERDLLGYDC